jgi:hypothetical protein
MNITPRNANIRSLFQANFYQVPRFQRPYSWDRENVEDFWNDAIVNGESGYFIGSMVLYGVSGSEEVHVVDGQQRLTTITIFLSALREAMKDAGEMDLSHGIQTIIQRRDFKNNLRYVLMTESSYPYFQEYIQKLDPPEVEIAPSDEEKGLASAFQFAGQRLQRLVEEAAATKASPKAKRQAVRARLERIRDLILALDVVVIQLDQEDDAYIVFETLNTRGKDLEPRDLIKNHLTRLLPANSVDVDATKIKWNKWLSELSSSAVSLDPTTYLHHFWLSRHEYTPERLLYKAVKARVAKSNASEFLQEIIDDVSIYRRIFEPDNFPWLREEALLKEALLALSIFKVKQPTPMVLSLLRSYFRKKISLKQTKGALTAIERFHFLYTAIAGVSSSGGLSMMYAADARTLTGEMDAQRRTRHIREFMRKLEGRLPDWEVFSAGFAELKYSQADSRRRPVIHYILRKVDNAFRATDGIIEYGMMTIEHIAPQNPPLGTDRLEQYADIGNLILVGQSLNTQLNNRPFKEKIEIMRNAGVPLDPVLSAAEEWGPAQIRERTKLLAKKLYRI